MSRADHRPRRAIARAELAFVESQLLYRLWFFARHDVQAALATATASILPTQVGFICSSFDHLNDLFPVQHAARLQRASRHRRAPLDALHIQTVHSSPHLLSSSSSGLLFSHLLLSTSIASKRASSPPSSLCCRPPTSIDSRRVLSSSFDLSFLNVVVVVVAQCDPRAIAWHPYISYVWCVDLTNFCFFFFDFSLFQLRRSSIRPAREGRHAANRSASFVVPTISLTLRAELLSGSLLPSTATQRAPTWLEWLVRRSSIDL